MVINSEEPHLNVCPGTVPKTIGDIIEILSDRNAAWYHDEEKMRPVHVVLDCFGSFYDHINALQSTIKSLAAGSIHAAQSKAVKVSISREVEAIETAVKDILRILQAMPRRRGTPEKRHRSVDMDEEPVVISQSIETPKVVESIMGKPVDTKATNPELHDSDSISDLRYLSHAISTETLNEAASSRRSSLINARPPVLSLSVSALTEFSTSLGLEEMCRSLEIASLPTDKPTKARHCRNLSSISRLEKLDEGYEGDKEPLTSSPTFTNSSLIKTGSDATTARTSIAESLDEEKIAAVRALAADLQTVTHSFDEGFAPTPPLRFSKHSKLQSESWESLTNAYRMSSDSLDDDPEAAPSHVREASCEILQFSRPTMLVKSKRNSSLTSNYSYAHSTEHESNASEKPRSCSRMSMTASRPVSAYATPVISGRCSAMSIRSHLEEVESKIVPEFIVKPQLDHGLVNDAGLLCLDKSQQYSLADLARLQRYFGGKLEQVAIKATKVQVSRNRLSSVIHHDGNHWRFMD